MLEKRSSGITHKHVYKIGTHPGEILDAVTIEEPLEIVLSYPNSGMISKKSISITMRTPGEDDVLALGFLYTEGIIDSITDVNDIEIRFTNQSEEATHQTITLHIKKDLSHKIKNLERHFYTSSSCGVCGKTSIDLALQHGVFVPKKDIPKITTDLLFSLPEKLRAAQEQFSKTGSIHGCALFTSLGELVAYAEDVGRHNALDKLAGKMLKLNLLPVDELILLLSGRVSFDMAQKAAAIGSAFIAAIGAPSSLAIEIAQTQGMSLVGFLRAQSANVYSGHQRIVSGAGHI